MYVLITRGSHAVAKAAGTTPPVPTMEEIESLPVTVVSSFDYGGVRVITSHLGEFPPEWRWVPFTELQAEAGSIGLELGEALLCGI